MSNRCSMWTALLILSLAIGCSRAATSALESASTPPTPPEVAKLTPRGLEGIWLGMTQAELTAARPKAIGNTAALGAKTFRSELVEAEPDEFIIEVTYYCTTGPSPTLYEMIVDYSDAARHDAVLARYQSLGTADEKGEITIPNKDFPVHVWTAGPTKLVVAGYVANSEWADQ